MAVFGDHFEKTSEVRANFLRENPAYFSFLYQQTLRSAMKYQSFHFFDNLYPRLELNKAADENETGKAFNSSSTLLMCSLPRLQPITFNRTFPTLVDYFSTQKALNSF